MQLHCSQLSGAAAKEIYLTAVADPGGDAGGQAASMFAAAFNEVTRAAGRICRERVFVPDGQFELYRRARAQCLPSAGAGRMVEPTWLRAGSGAAGSVQVHAIAGLGEPSELQDSAGRMAALLWSNGRHRWAITGPICTPRQADEQAAARIAFESAERLLAQAGMGLGDVARTWFFLDDILAWYDPFNAARNALFKARGLLAPGQADSPVPASTGIGVSPACGSRVALEVFAAGGPNGTIARRPAAGRQRSPYEYGSAFARASAVASPAGRTVFVSGTAAIDSSGRSCFLGDAAGQIRMTLDNVLAVLGDMDAPPESVVQAMAYCKTPAVAAEFAAHFQAARGWPWVVAVADVCRPELLFEAEVTACTAG
jgi:enamine deaminase RidA (YjgF/YER057c/UK114 family)